MRTPVIYLAGPIDEDETKGTIWRETVGKHITRLGALVISPAHMFMNAELHAASVIGVNKVLITIADILVAWVPGYHTCFGTIREIEHATTQGTKVIVVVEDDRDKLRSLAAFDVVQANGWEDPVIYRTVAEIASQLQQKEDVKDSLPSFLQGMVQ